MYFFVPVMAKLNFQKALLQCHMILKKPFWYADLFKIIVNVILLL